MQVAGNNILPDAVIVQVNIGTQVTMNLPANGSATEPISFYAVSDGTSQSINSPPVFVVGSVGTNSMFFNPRRLSFKVNVSNQLPLLRTQHLSQMWVALHQEMRYERLATACRD